MLTNMSCTYTLETHKNSLIHTSTIYNPRAMGPILFLHARMLMSVNFCVICNVQILKENELTYIF